LASSENPTSICNQISMSMNKQHNNFNWHHPSSIPSRHLSAAQRFSARLCGLTTHFRSRAGLQSLPPLRIVGPASNGEVSFLKFVLVTEQPRNLGCSSFLGGLPVLKTNAYPANRSNQIHPNCEWLAIFPRSRASSAYASCCLRVSML
jgi:hypothetical protein